MALSIAVVAFVSYKDTLNYFFIGGDALSLIETSRVRSFQDVIRILNEPLMNGTAFVEAAKFYRPVSTFSFSLDYAIWKLNPFGYHLTDLLLHMVVSVLVFFLLKRLTDGNQITAWVGAFFFSTHPALVNCIPVARNDISASLFLLLSFLLFLKTRPVRPETKVYVAFSVLCYVLALGAKEIAIILPALIVFHLLLFPSSGEKAFPARLAKAAKTSVPYLIATVIVLGWRTYVLQGLGGYNEKPPFHFAPGAAYKLFGDIKQYFFDLLYPVDFLRSPFHHLPNISEQIVSLAGLLVLCTLILLYRRTVFRIVLPTRARLPRALALLLGVLALGSLGGILAYPLASAHINHLIQQAYQGQGLPFLMRAMEGREVLPVESYVSKANDSLFRFLFATLFFCTVGFLFVRQWNQIKRFLLTTSDGKLLVFLLAWLFLPLGVHLMTSGLAHYQMYMAVIPFSMILAILLAEIVKSLVRNIKEYHVSGSDDAMTTLSVKGLACIVVIGLIVSCITYSPLLRTYRDWEDIGKINSMFLHKLSQIAYQLPQDAIVEVFDFPVRFAHRDRIIPSIKDTGTLTGYSIKSWLDLRYSKSHTRFVLRTRSVPAAYPRDFDLVVRAGDGNKVAVLVRVDENNGS